ECEKSQRSPCPSQLALLPDGKTLAASFWNEGVTLWDAATGKTIRQLGSSRGGVEFFTVSADGQTILAGHEAVRRVKADAQKTIPGDGMVNISEHSLCLWDVATGKEVWAVSHGGLHIPAHRGIWGYFSSRGGGQDHNFRVRVSAHGQPFFTPAPGYLP